MEQEKQITRNEQIHAKGFDMSGGQYSYSTIGPQEYKKIKVGVKTLDDAVLNLGSFNQTAYGRRSERYNQERIYTKPMVMDALIKNDVYELRRISRFFFRVSGIYQRVCNYFANMYRYDWAIAIQSNNNDGSVKDINETKAIKDFWRILNYLDNSYIKKICGDIALEVIKCGAYYGYIVPSSNGLILQQLPIDYCRSRYSVGNLPAIEFNMKYFDTFTDTNYRNKILKLFPDEFTTGYRLYKAGKLIPDIAGDNSGSWYLLDPQSTIKFALNGLNDLPLFINAIPAILDLDAAQDLDRRKQMQKLLKILVQKLPMDKNGDLIFDVDEARDIHNNAVEMLRRAVGVDVLTTFADVDAIDTSDKNTSATTDELERVERTVYNAFGVSRNLFNTDGNLSLEKSILDDESTMRNLILQFNIFFDRILSVLNVQKKYNYKFYMLETTQYNYKDLSKMYKEQTQIGFSKMLPQIALGQSQSFILNTAHFENEVLHLSEVMIPPLMSSTLNGEDILGKKDSSNSSNSQNNTDKVSAETKSAGRPEKPDDQKSEKTIANRESSAD